MNDTIAAVSTPEGRGGISIVRISGPDTLQIIQKLFIPRSFSSSKLRPWKVYCGYFQDPDTSIIQDEILVTFFKGPQSYTGEDAAEFSCHGSPFITQSLLEIVIRMGARPADPGEFTRRAFENGKIDLSQAEAVAMITASESENARRAALNMLQGGLARPVRNIRDSITRLRVILEIDLDFPEEAITIDSQSILQTFLEAEIQLQNLVDAGSAGDRLRQCRQIVISGKVNAGKSSLFNQLTGRDRAIVSTEEGTTRDLLEAMSEWHGCRLTLVDTAGIRESHSAAETEAVKRSLAALETADAIIYVIDGANPDVGLLETTIKLVRESAIVIFWNKTDICPPDQSLVEQIQTDPRISGFLQGSARFGWGIVELRTLLRDLLDQSNPDIRENPILMMTIRQRNALEQSLALIRDAGKMMRDGIEPECIVPSLRSIDHHLGSILGDTLPPDILGEIFAGFCIGK
ncbi:tRNA uridine-5-carboxymethylaminomethyl(34) synthesis GTPase MnmE [bacterium]|nr:tRNA uridine-5-carboxymethylaminomethyl(34) synthesis GTPase MnmE [candidate division CSSED10-310 bacterium]